jgi:glycosyltransferase involved in cell wall biosynthesis
MLGENGLEMVKKFTWDEACRKVANVYELSLKPEPPTCSIIIPCYNYAERVSRAIEGAINQTYGGLTEIVIVDDGSDDGDQLRDVVNGYAMADNRIRLMRQENKGVAIARNAGIYSTETKYTCCLDADDTMDPAFITTCVGALEKDRSLGIAYTGLYYIKPDASEGVSSWPGEWNYDAQIKRKNQIPTCCVFRRSMFNRLGGYRQRYAPMGAGSEDAEFWLRSGAYGFKAEKVTPKPLFIYSWMSGRVSGNPEYQEVDWLDWHPWVKDNAHPFFSMASPTARSHPARSYDEPVVSVIIPVGPGHEDYLIDALDSLEAQSFRKWEVIIVNDSDEELDDRLKETYPYVRWYWLGENFGAGVARNMGAEKARGPFLLFLDADDYLTPDCLELMLAAWKDEEAIIYTDYVGRAFIDDFSKLAPDLQERVYQTNKRTGESFIGYRSADYDVERAQKQPEWEEDASGRLKLKPYLWCNVTALIPKDWHDEIGGFDESLKTWEDVDYHWRMAKAGKCYTRIAEELMVYRFYSGGRREEGLLGWKSVVEYLQDKYKGIEIVGCGCKGGRSSVTKALIRTPVGATIETEVIQNLTDDNFVMAKYLHRNRGNHHVIGAATKTKYGYRGGGSQFLVNIEDVKAQPHLFEVIDGEAKVPEQTVTSTAPPVAI